MTDLEVFLPGAGLDGCGVHLGALAPMSDEQLTRAADELVDHLCHLSPGVRVAAGVLPAPSITAQESHQ